MSVFDC